MRDDIRFGPCRKWHDAGGQTGCQQMPPGYRIVFGKRLCFHAISIVEQENWGNAIYVMAGDNFAVWAKPVPLPS